ncbi:hypothetical protein IGI04_019188 [Brassica rapa subsp. trilocularis]|uniref:Uncharacterized protein n=1 Tax=Brassica rapa subsp. trilocularis TaxID=1813537 RepID=A0ABQ7MF46_BRACM|nr:hypothetical protein IGI04_019188 [Brassica rapa subsp. trilocularis]
MMFTDGEEPVGVRVLTYQSSRSINTILNALNEDEIRYLRESSYEIQKRTQLNMKPWSYGVEHSPPYVQNSDQHFLKYLALNLISNK